MRSNITPVSEIFPYVDTDLVFVLIRPCDKVDFTIEQKFWDAEPWEQYN